MKVAIIGASEGQKQICIKAKEIGYETYCFAWEQGAICKELVDHFIPISIFEMDKIVEYCRDLNLDGVFSNGANRTALVASYVAEKLGLDCTPYDTMLKISNKEYVRKQTQNIHALQSIKVQTGSIEELIETFNMPFVLKPIVGGGKKGVYFINSKDDLKTINLPQDLEFTPFLAEEFIKGKEYSVESLSFRGQHQVIQITEKISGGAPHFVELAHHQPALLSDNLVEKIKNVVPAILTSIGYVTGPSHTEIKIHNDMIYLIEVNPRGGGDQISNRLIELSTDCDYAKQICYIATGQFKPCNVHNLAYSGIYYLCQQTAGLEPIFSDGKARPTWIEELVITNEGPLIISEGNWSRNGYFIYKSDRKIDLKF